MFCVRRKEGGRDKARTQHTDPVPSYPYLRAHPSVLCPSRRTQDTAFSILVTALFLRPIMKVMGEAGVAANQSAGYRSMNATKWMTLLGSSGAVISSTALYAIFFVYSLSQPGSPFWANPLLHPLVFPVNADSVVNDFGMLLVCGVLKALSLKKLASTARNSLPLGRYAVEPAEPEQLPFDSRACENSEAS